MFQTNVVGKIKTNVQFLFIYFLNRAFFFR